MIAAVAVFLILRERRTQKQTMLTAIVAVVAMLLTPAVWSAVTIATPNSTNPTAGGVSSMGLSLIHI